MRILLLVLALFASSAFGADTAITDKNTVEKTSGVLSTDAGTLCLKGSSSGCTPLNASAAAGSTPLVFPAGGAVATVAGVAAGNAATATALQTARAINGVNFDGSAPITVTAAAGTLSGSTLASGVTASSLTSAGGGSFGTAAFTATSAYDAAGAASTAVSTLNASNLSSGTVAAGRMPAMTGDVTTSAGAVATTLATVNGNVGTFGSATQASVITVNAKGLATAASGVTVTPAIGSITGLGAGVATWLASASPIRCASGTLSGALTLGSVNTATASCTGARNTMSVACNYVADPGTLVAAPKCVVSSNDVVTVTQSGLGVVTPTSTTVQIVIMP